MTIEAILPEKTGETTDDKDLLKGDPMRSVKSLPVCRLPNCNRTFEPDVHNKEFCYPDHQAQFWILARRLGKVVMDEIQKEREVEK